MKILLSIILLSLISCANYSYKQNKKTSISDEYLDHIGQSYYITDNDGSAFAIKDYKIDGKNIPLYNGYSLDKCQKAKVVDVIQSDKSKSVNPTLPSAYIVEQNKKLYVLGGIWSSKEDTMFKKTFPFKSRAIKLKTGTKSSKDLICKGMIWTGMTETEMIFVKGQPIKVNKTTRRGLIQKQNIYEDSKGKRSYFYTINGILKSWQN